MYNQLNWGTLHEMNHHMEGTLTSYNNRGRWGMDIHETNNNVMNAMFHIEYTNVAGNRENGIGDWGFITDGYWTMKDVYLGNVKSYIQLRSYVAPAFSFGTQAVKQVIKNYYNLFYEEDYGTKFNKDRNDTGIYCLLTARAIERDTRYFCKIFGYEIDSAIASYIKGLNYKTWFPFYNLYSNSYDGNKYGRVYHVPYQIKTRLNFNEKTAMDNTTTKVKFEILDGFKKGTIEEISSGVYDYTANFKPNETDTFKVKMTFNVNGESGSIVFGGEFVTTNKMKKVDVYTLESKPSNIQKAEEMIKDKEPNSMRTSSSAGIAAYNDKVGEVDKSTVNIMRGNLVVPDSGYYTLFVKCDDYGKLEVNMSGELEKIGERGSYLGSYDKTNANTFKTVVLKKEETYEYIITNVNTGGQGSFDIGYCYHGDRESDVDMDKCTPANIPTNWVFCDGLTKSDVETPYVFPEIKYPRKIYNLNYKMYTVKDCNSTVCGVECLELPIKHDDSNVCENIFDRDTNTIYHSKYSGNGTPFPTTYKFNYTEIAKFDSIEMKFRRSEDSFGLFNMYCGNEKEEYVNILSVTENKTQQQKTFTFDKIYECKYIKMDVQNNAAGNKYVVLQDFNMFLSQSYKNLAKPTAKTFNVIGFKTKSALGYFENVLLENEKAGEGQIEFKMKGSKLGVFGEYRGGMGSWTLLVDGKAPTMDQELQSNSNIQRTLYQVFTFDEGTHNMILKVKEGFVNIDVVGFE
ncbi:antigenic protein NP1, putative [Entamoeba invadens IP1]|uniref:Antigenic protein NP1, putative n=1 Tax=Entamoeba invadens IP1 TaxID=370355 RepID=A0A0A1U7F2_ENTIV|nr:antigenic protein NP1, putative [Entamoeba invadens IP1]ELP90332.1 antigenic protein NP1, putative [Entamoeba invadens IP1]|eukprot:XP_004257103.1 antigenic protein NP1, putative [Entamoeba invadens IP1]